MTWSLARSLHSRATYTHAMTRSVASWLFTRRWLLFAAALTIALGLASRAFLHGPPAKIMGVALYATLVYWLVRTALPRGDRGIPSRASSLVAPAVVALAISWAVESLQLTPVPAKLSAIHPILRHVFGEVFNATDLIWYSIGVVAGTLIELSLRAAIRRAPANPRPGADYP